MPSTRNRGRNCDLLSAKLVEVGLLRRRDASIDSNRVTKTKLKRLPSSCKKIKQELDDDQVEMLSKYPTARLNNHDIVDLFR